MNTAPCVTYRPGLLAQAHLPDERCEIEGMVAS